MTDLPLVSVTIVTYNQKDYLKEAIESTLAQTYPNLEIIIADDCSTDGSQEMAQEYKKKYPTQIVLNFSEKNMGVTINCNIALKSCTGKYVAWFAGDDLMEPEKIRKQVEFLENNSDHNIVYHNLNVFDSASGKNLRLFNEKKNSYTGNVRTLIKYGAFNGGCSNMVRREATPLSGFDTSLPVASDWFFYISHLLNGGKIGYINEVLGKYRRHDKNVTSRDSPFAQQGYLDHIKTCEIVLEKYPMYIKEINYRLSIIHRTARKFNYQKHLLKSLMFNFYNFRTAIALSLYFLSFKKIKI